MVKPLNELMEVLLVNYLTAFSIYNRSVDGLSVLTPEYQKFYSERAKKIAQIGYVKLNVLNNMLVSQ